MSWAALAESDILDRLTSDELEAYEAGGELTTRDRMTGILAQVTELVRGKVASNDENLAKMGNAGTIPSETKWAAATIARNSLVASLPLIEGNTDARKEEMTRAFAILDQAADGTLRIASPDGTIPETTNGGAGSYGGNALLNF